MGKPQQQQLLASLVSWSPWTTRIVEERNGSQAAITSSPAPQQEDKKSGSKKVVTWDELVHVRKFQPFEEEFAKRNGSPRVRRPTRHEGERSQQTADTSREGEEGGSAAFPTNGWDSRYLTSPMYDL